MKKNTVMMLAAVAALTLTGSALAENSGEWGSIFSFSKGYNNAPAETEGDNKKGDERSIDWYKEHKAEREAQIAKCNSDPKLANSN